MQAFAQGLHVGRGDDRGGLIVEFPVEGTCAAMIQANDKPRGTDRRHGQPVLNVGRRGGHVSQVGDHVALALQEGG